MMHTFLSHNRDELIRLCKAKVSRRVRRDASDVQLQNGVPLFIDQLIRTLVAEETEQEAVSLLVSGPSGGDALALSEIGVGAVAHGKALLALGYSVDQVVHDYGDLCQAITELAEVRDAPFAIDEFRTLNRCLDNAIADAVTSFSAQRDLVVAKQSIDAHERLGALVHELRNALQLSKLAVRAMELGGLTFVGATGSVLKRSLESMRLLVDSATAEVRVNSAALHHADFSLANAIADAAASARLEADVRGCTLLVSAVDATLRIEANRDMLLRAIGNLLSNAFKFTRRHSTIRLSAYALNDGLRIDVEDCCGGLAPNFETAMFAPFTQLNADRSGLGLGLSISRMNVESMGGTLTVKNLPGVGCVFTIGFPLSAKK